MKERHLTNLKSTNNKEVSLMQPYEKLLERAMKKVSRKPESEDRFKIPKSNILRAGARTIINNFIEIANNMRRDPNHLLKFLLKELATSGEIQNNRVIVQGRFRPEIIDKKIEIYIKEYVVCHECKKYDTKLIKEDKFFFVKCEACGAKHSVKKL